MRWAAPWRPTIAGPTWRYAGQGLQMNPSKLLADISDWDTKTLSTLLLNVASRLDDLLSGGLKPPEALAKLRTAASQIPKPVLDALTRIPLDGSQTVTRLVGLKQLTPGMLLDEDVMSSKGIRLVPQGQEVTRTML